MNVRQRFVNTVHFRPVDHPPLWPIFGVWQETLRRWHKEGLAEGVDHGSTVKGYVGYMFGTSTEKMKEIFKWSKKEESKAESVSLEEYFSLNERAEYVPVNFRFCPPFPVELVEEKKNTIAYVGDEGVLVRQRKDDPELSMPQFLEFPVRTRRDFEQKIRHRMDPDSPDRFPKNWKEECQRWGGKKRKKKKEMFRFFYIRIELEVFLVL